MDRHVYKALFYRVGAIALDFTIPYAIYRTIDQSLTVGVLLSLFGIVWYLIWEKVWDEKVKRVVVSM